MLRRETEALGLVEVRGDFGRGDVGNRLRDGIAPGEVVRVELSGVELSRVHGDGAYHRAEFPVAGAGHVGQELDRHGAAHVRMLDGADPLAQLALVAVTGHRAQHVVERHQRKAEPEAAGRDGQQLPGHVAILAPQVAHFAARTSARTMKPK